MSEIFPIHAASGRPGSLVLLFVLGLVALFLFIGYSARATRYVVSEEGVAIQRTLYGRALGWDELVTEEARLVDLDGVTLLLEPAADRRLDDRLPEGRNLDLCHSENRVAVWT